MQKGNPLPKETRDYVVRINAILGGKDDGTSIFAAKLTRPDGSEILVDPAGGGGGARRAARRICRRGAVGDPAGRAPDPGVREDLKSVTEAIRLRGGKI